MFKEIIAIDVHERVPQFVERLKPFVSEKINVFASSDEAFKSTKQYPSVDAVVISIYQTITQEQLRTLPALSHIFILGTSLKKIPLEYCHEHNIAVSNITGYCDHETAEWVIMQALKYFRERDLPQSAFQKTLGVVGVGAVGSIVAHLGLALGMNLLYHSPKPHAELSQKGAQYADLSDLFAACDIISAHTPPQAVWLKFEHLQKAKADFLFINTCMGRVDYHDDLSRALAKRPDITLVLDSIALSNYPDLTARAHVIEYPAFKTIDSEKRLVDKLFGNIKKATQQLS